MYCGIDMSETLVQLYNILIDQLTDICSDYKPFSFKMDVIKIRPVNLYRLSQITEKNDTGIKFC